MTGGQIFFEAESYKDALVKGLLYYNKTEDEVNVEIVDEKKQFLFKKGYVKLKITPKEYEPFNEEAATDIIDNVLTIINKVEEVQESKSFIIEYKEEGVCLTVNPDAKVLNDRGFVEEIINYVKDKEIDKFEIIAISKAVKEKIPTIIAPQQEEKIIDSNIKFDINRTKMEARISLTKPIGGDYFTLEKLKAAIADYGIVYGINDQQLEEMVNRKLIETYFTIATGKEAIDGIDGKIIYHFNTSKDFKPIFSEDGTVDYKQLNIISNVVKGQLLAEIIIPTEGVAGYDVFGNQLNPKRGKDVKFKAGKNVVESEDGLKLYAAIDGQVMMVDGKIVVSEVYAVQGNVDNSTGNINFNGTVQIKGNVKAGFTIKAEGSIEVHGVVEGATLIANGDIILNRGVQGSNQCYLECGGNLIAKYIESAKINVVGNVESDCILHSSVHAKGKINVVGKKGLIAGGEVRAGEEIRVRNIGSNMGTSTKIEVGIDPAEREKYEALKAEIGEVEKNMDQLKKTIEVLSRAAKTNQLPKAKEEMFVKSIKTYEYLKDKYQKLLEEDATMEAMILNLNRGKIHVSGMIYPGVKVTILNATRHFNDEVSYCTLYKKDGEVYIGPHEA